MISTCVGCGRVLAKYAPLDEVRWELCADCVRRQSHQERRALTCGADACVYEEVPYECLRYAAAGEKRYCPVLREQAEA